MKEVEFYWLPACSTCKKAKQFLENQGFTIRNLRDLKTEPLSLPEVQKLAETAGSVENLFSRRAIKYRELKLNERTLSDEEMLDLMSTEYTFIKRPILVFQNNLLSGFSEKQYQKLSEEK